MSQLKPNTAVWVGFHFLTNVSVIGWHLNLCRQCELELFFLIRNARSAHQASLKAARAYITNEGVSGGKCIKTIVAHVNSCKQSIEFI